MTASYWKQARETLEAPGVTQGDWLCGVAGSCTVVRFNGDDITGVVRTNNHDDAVLIVMAKSALPLALTRIEELEAALTKAADDLENAVSYVPEYFQDKWSMADDVKAARAALSKP